MSCGKYSQTRKGSSIQTQLAKDLQFGHGGHLSPCHSKVWFQYRVQSRQRQASSPSSASRVPLKTSCTFLLASTLVRISRISFPKVFSSVVASKESTLRHLRSSNLSPLLWRRTLVGVRTYIIIIIITCYLQQRACGDMSEVVAWRNDDRKNVSKHLLSKVSGKIT